MTTLGQAYVQIMPSAKGISGSIQKTINPEATAAGKSAGRNIASSIAGSLSSAGSTLTKAITVPVLGAATAIGGMFSALGFSRLVGIDTAQAKLKGLGHDAESIEKIMDSALDSVKGTSYGLDEAATSAAGAVAAGIQPGQDLTRYLSLTGDAAAIAGSSMGEMGSIFGKVQTAQKAYTGELNMLADRGIPIFQWLAEEAGTTAEGVRDMASSGEVSSELFLKAIENNIGGAAKTMGEESFTAGIANIGAAIGRVGAEFLDAGGKGGGFFSTIKPLTSDLIGFIDNLAGSAADFGVKFGEAFSKFIENVQNAIQWWTNLDGSTQKLILTIAGIAVAIGPVLMIAGKLITTVMNISQWFGILKLAVAPLITAISGISAPVLIVIGVITGLIALFTTLYQKNEAFRDLVQTVWTTIKETITTVVQAVTDFVMEIFNSFVEWWNENQALIQETASTVWNAIKTVIENVMNFLAPFITSIWEGIKLTVTVIWEAIKTVIEVVVALIQGIIKTAMQIITGDWSGAWETIKSTVSSIFGSVKDFITETATTIWNNIKDKFQDIVDSVKEKMNSAFDAIQDIWGKVMDFFENIDLKQIGKDMISGLVDGIKSMGSSLVNSAKGVVDSAIDGAKNLLGISSPSKVFMEIGEDTGKGMEIGMRSMDGRIREASEHMANSSIPKQSNNTSGYYNKDLLDATLQQNQLLMQLVQKDTNVYLDKRNVTDELAPDMSKEINRLNKIGARRKGVIF